jgi:hypothetical protein
MGSDGEVAMAGEEADIGWMYCLHLKIAKNLNFNRVSASTNSHQCFCLFLISQSIANHCLLVNHSTSSPLKNYHLTIHLNA